MTSRVGTYASTNLNVQQVLALKQSLDNLTTQVTTGQKSQDYAGISTVAGDLINFDDQHSSITNYQTSNALLGTSLSTMQSAYSSIQTTIQQFKQTLENFIGNSQNSPEDVQKLQTTAFQYMKDMEYYLNLQAGGKYLFSGSKTNTPPVSIPAATLSQFQSQYDGYSVVYPTTRSADVNTVSTTIQDTGNLTFDTAKGTITAANKGQFAGIAVGANITVAGSKTYDGTYTVLANDGTSVTISHNLVNEGAVVNEHTPTLANEAAPAAASLTDGATSYLNAATGNLTFNAANHTIAATTAGSLGTVKVGDTVHVAGTAGNDGVYTVTGSTGTVLTVAAANPIITDGTTSYGSGSTGNLSFNAANNTITAATANGFAGVKAGDTIQVGGTLANNGTYTVLSTNGTTLQLGSPALTITKADGTKINVTATIAQPDTLTSTSQNGFAGLVAGDSFSISGAADPANNGNFTVASTDGTHLVIQRAQFTSGANLTSTAADASAVITSQRTAYGNGATVNTGTLAFASPNTITAATAGSLANIPLDSVITIAGSSGPPAGANDGAYFVTGNDGTNLTVQAAERTSLTSQTAAATATLTSGTTVLTNANTGNLNFYPDSSVITATTTGSLSQLKAGQTVTVGGTLSNNGTYRILGTYTDSIATATTPTVANDPNSAAQLTVNGNAPLTLTTPVSFVAGTPPTLTTATANDFAKLKAGDIIDVAGATNAANNGRYVVAANNGSGTLTLATAQMVVNGTAAPYLQSPLNFTAGAAPTVQGSTADLGSIKVGDVVNFSGTSTNNGAFVVTSAVSALGVTTLTFAPPNTAVKVAQDIGVSTSSYYQGDATTASQQVDAGNTLTYGVTAIDPAFEKALRAMAMIAQGQTGTVGSLSMNMGRLQNADYLIMSALNNSATGTGPYGTEQSSNINDLAQTLAQQQNSLNNVTTQQKTYLGYVDTQRGNLSSADSTETIVKLLNQQNALQASYQSLATVRQMSLLNYMK